MITIQDLQVQAQKALDAITAETDQDNAIVALVNSNTAIITSLRKQLAEAIGSQPPPSQASFQQVFDLFSAVEKSELANAASVVAAVKANTGA